MLSNQFKQRLLLGSLGIVALAFCIYFSSVPFFKPIFILLNIGIVSLALLEYYQLAQYKSFQPLVKLGTGTTIAYLTAVAFSLHFPSLAALPSCILLLASLFFFLGFFNSSSSSIGNLAVTLFGIAYLTIPLSCALRINYFFPPTSLEDGRLWLAYVLMVSKMTDVGAYFTGKSLGKTPLAPSISPKKTVEGAIGGVSAALLTSLLFYGIFPSTPSFQLTFMQSIGMGVVLSILSQLGDLGESLLKRDAAVKDSSHLPGLGGILDIVDSLVFTLPFMYLLLEMHLVNH